jgi:hypothetical protein
MAGQEGSVMDLDGLVGQLQTLLPMARTLRTYNEIEAMFPQGTGLEELKKELRQLASDCGCDFKDQPHYQNIAFTKRS